MQAMATADPQAKWLMQAWLFYDKQEFWKPPQIKVGSACLSKSCCSQFPREPAGSLRLTCAGCARYCPLAFWTLRNSQKASYYLLCYL